MKRLVKRRIFARASVAALSVATAADVASAQDGRYVTGDFHNHTTCSDGTLSVQKLVDKSAGTYGLDWFVQSGHGGNSARNCTLAEDPFEPVPPALNLPAGTTIPAGGQLATDGAGPNQTWVDTLPGGANDIKGDVVLQNGVRAMWKWQEMQEFMYPVLETEAHDRNKPIFQGLEQNSPGHEHVSTAIVDGQLPRSGVGDADAISQYEYCFDRSDTDLSRGAENQWNCAVPGSTVKNAQLDARGAKLVVASGVGSGTLGHEKTVEGIKWMNAFSPKTSYFVPAHLERQGPFNPDGNNGYNIEHLRDFNNAAPQVAFGFESMPGHQAESNRGSYTANAVGGGTYGGTGIYAADVGGVWDALLGEGRHWWFFASSDFHNRGSFGPDQLETTADFFPGEYTKDHVLVRNGSKGKFSTHDIVNGLRSGNSFVANGGLIDRLAFTACVDRGKLVGALEEAATIAAAATDVSGGLGACATMGETLSVKPGDNVVVYAVVRDPLGRNNSPYSFANPSLQQLGVSQPLNAPVLDHVDVITGNVTGKVAPGSANYAGLTGSPAATNPSAAVVASFGSHSWKALPGGLRVIRYTIKNVAAAQYVRLRGTNLPAATPFETDSEGNPLLDANSQGKIKCTDAACPAHLTTTEGVKYASNDVAAWSDLWFYANPIFIDVKNNGR